jgi:hypothetical protein
MAENLTVTEAEIKAVCSYLKNDAFIASYFGIDRERVSEVRAKRVRRDYRRPASLLITYAEPPVVSQTTDRSPCPRCGIRRDVGCRHSA